MTMTVYRRTRPAKRKQRAGAGRLIVLFWIIAATLPAHPPLCAAETLSGTMRAANGYSWPYGFEIESQEDRIVARVAVNLIPAGGVTRPEIDRVKERWEEGAEGYWSGKFAIVDQQGRRWPIIVDVVFTGRRAHHDIIVRPGGGRSDSLNWNIMDSTTTVAHEIGHLLGAYDEYAGGAVDPESGTVDAGSIMAGTPAGDKTHARHYRRLRAWFMGRTGIEAAELVPLPAPEKDMGPGKY